jgi:hypothetical protein
MQPEYASYDVEKFLSRLSSLRKTDKEANTRAEDNEEAFNNYKQNPQPSAYSHKCYLNWQGSDAQVLLLLLEDMEAGKLERLGKKELWEKQLEYHECFPLPAFRYCIYQEIRTSKYLDQLIVHRRNQITIASPPVTYSKIPIPLADSP